MKESDTFHFLLSWPAARGGPSFLAVGLSLRLLGSCQTPPANEGAARPVTRVRSAEKLSLIHISRQDLQLISGLPPLVREKDRFSALLTLRNGTARAMAVRVSARQGDRALEGREVKLDAESAAELVWPGEAPENESMLVWEFEAVETGEADKKDGVGKDRLRITQQIAPAVPIAVQQASFARIEGKLDIPAALPAGAVSGKSGPLGGIEVGLSARLSTPPPGLKRFFEDYPFV